jgi:hypothetical protein
MPVDVSVRFHESVEADLHAWLADLLRRPGGAVLASTYLDEMRKHLTALAGELPEAIADQTRRPVEYWWEYLPGFWIAYVRRDEGWFRKRRRIIIVSVGGRPPDRAV